MTIRSVNGWAFGLSVLAVVTVTGPGLAQDLPADTLTYASPTNGIAFAYPDAYGIEELTEDYGAAW